MSLAIHDIQYFLAVSQAGQLSSVAAELGVTQSALTKAIHRVEREFGLQLFERSVRGMDLTSAGLRVIGQMRKIQADYADTVLLADEMRAQQAGLLRLGVTDTTAGNRMGSVLGPLLKQRPGLRVKMRVDRSDALAAQVHDGTLDLALVPAYESQPFEVTRTIVGHDPLLPLVRAGHPLTSRSPLTLKDIAAFGWIMGPEHSMAYRALEEVFVRDNLPPPSVVLEIPFSSEMNFAVLEATDLVTLVPRSLMKRVSKERLTVLSMPALQIPRTIALLSRPNSEWSPLMETLRDHLLRPTRRNI